MKNLKHDHQSSEGERLAKARGLLEQMAGLFTNAGVPTKAYTSPDLPIFRKHSPVEQDDLIRELEARVELFASAAAENISLRDNRQILWRSLKRGGWTPNSDVFDLITDDDTVEIYSVDMKQIFRNLAYFQWISYTLEEIHGGTWYELTTRDPQIQEQLMNEAMKLVRGETRASLDVRHIPNHMIQEVSSSEKRRCMIEMKVLSPVFRDGVLVAFIAVNRTRPCE